MKKLVSLFIAARLYIVAIPFSIALTGAVMNQAAMVANGGAMPVQLNDLATELFQVDKNDMIDFRHCRMTSNTRLNWMSDFINFGLEVLSPGDLLIYLGTWLSTYAVGAWSALVINDYARK